MRRNDFFRQIGFRFQHDDFFAVRALRRFAQRKWIGGDRTRRANSGALEQRANHKRFSQRSRSVHNDTPLSFTCVHNGNLFSRTIAVPILAVHTNSVLSPEPTMDSTEPQRPTQEEIDDESRRMRRLRILVYLALDTIASGSLSPEEAASMAAATRKLALDMFPGKERAFDLLYRPKFQRVMHEVYRLQ
jgi:hypothetical protein